MFIQKAVSIWTGKSDIDHIETVGEYLLYSNAFDPDTFQSFDAIQEFLYSSNSNSNSRSSKMNFPMMSLTNKPKGDPLYVVKATKKRL